MMLRFPSDASSALILARGKARHSSSQGLFAAGPPTCQRGSPQHARGATALREEAGAAAEPRGPPDAAPPGSVLQCSQGPLLEGRRARLSGRVGREGPGLSLTASQPRWLLSGPERPRTKFPHTPCPKSRPFQAFPGLSRSFQSPNVLWFFLLPHSLPGPCSLRIDRVWGFTGLGPPASQALRPHRAPGGGTGLGQRPKGQLRAGRSPGRVEPPGPHPGPSLVTGLGARPAREPPWNWR